MRNVKINLYEVGDIFLTLNNINPGTRFKGTWELIAKGRTLVGVDPDDTDFNVVEKTGGEKKHKLTIDEMPKHNHRLNLGADTGWTTIPKTGASATTNGTNAIYSAGNDQPHNNLQPYLTCYIWCRTA